jgi:hypothetical protein
MPRKKLRPLGDITQDLEPLYFEMVHDHKMQAHEVIGQFLAWVEVHYPDAIEEYLDGTKPKQRGIKYGNF